MEDLSDINVLRDRVRTFLSDGKMTIAQLSEMSGVHRATIHRFLDEEYEFTPSLRTMRGLIAVIRGEITSLPSSKKDIESPPNTPTQSLEISTVVSAGLWLTLKQRRSFSKASSPLARLPRTHDADEDAMLLMGSSCEPAFLDGDILRIANFQGRSARLNPNDYVVVVGQRGEQLEMEFTVRKVVEADDDIATLAFPSRAAHWSAELDVPVGGTATVEGATYYVWGKVIGFYRDIRPR